ncbi:LacI family DNA-binding transcriptional regulator [Paenibacillus sp. GSMTC-2017]|uniref:LacI family DNA-binding transcriptional regulator n=1 Tax=Paenibacillus sp. GSMTC-2017 TaxID=2794350 RepID=UPI0018D7765F|nr:LacI family DNA-binding transcriptional regulator [Paenibacillus sp. GSMTC-2017]MBH5319637.1 LacI family DNA-binding transcriptional regulator [Paenibacillus sp. GSMTC-2017]
MKVSIFDVARKSGLSVVTVSRVINNAGTVREKNREKVLQAMQALNYHPNAAARSLARGKTGVIGITIATLNDSFLDTVVKEINDGLKAHQYLLALFISDDDESDLHHAIFQEDRVDGMIMLSPLSEVRYVDALTRKRIPFIMIDNQQENTPAPSIRVDNFRGGYLATKHLIDLGHTDIAHISGPEPYLSSKERVLGYLKAIAEAKLEPRIEPGKFTIESGYEIGDHWAKSGTLPTAVFAADDMMAFGVMDAFKNHGLQIPRDVSIVGYDDQLFATQLRPQLTTIRQPVEEIGRHAIDLLLRCIEDPNEQMSRIPLQLQPELLVRETTCAPSKSIQVKQ